MARVIQQTTTSQSIRVDIFDATTGVRKTGIAYTAAGLTAYYKLGGMGATSEAAITLVTLAAHTSAFSSGGFKEWRNGSYRLDIPDVSLATLGKVEISMTDTAGNTYVVEDILVVPYDPAAARADSNVTYWNGTAVVTPAVGGVPKVDMTYILGTIGSTAELSAVPSSTASFWDKISWVFMKSKNLVTQTATTQIVKANDSTTTVGTSTVSSDGTTASRGKFS